MFSLGLAILGSATFGGAQTNPVTDRTYIGPESGDYRDATNWDPASVPDNALGGPFNVFVPGDFGPRITGTPLTIANLTVTSAPIALSNTSLTVTTRTRVPNLTIRADIADASATLTDWIRSTLTLEAEAGRTITLRTDDLFITNFSPLQLIGPGTIRILGEDDGNLLADFRTNRSTLRIAGGHTFRRVNAAGVFDPENAFRNDSSSSSNGFVSVIADRFGETTRFEAGYVDQLGRIEIDGTGGLGATATLQFIDPNFTTAAADITLRGEGAFVVDQNGANALASLEGINPRVVLSIENDQNLTVSGPFTNNGTIRIVELTEGETSLTIDGPLAGISAEGTLADRGAATGGSVYEIRTGVSQTSAVPTATLRATGANVLSIGGVGEVRLTLAGPGARFVDETGQSALRNLRRIGSRAVFEIADGLDYTTLSSEPFENGGTMRVISQGVTFGNNVLTYNTRLTIGSSLANLLDGSTRLVTGTFAVVATAGSTATLRIPGADITTNNARIILDGPDTRIEDATGQDALRNFASQEDPTNVFGRGEIEILGGRVFTTSGNFSNGSRNSSIEVTSTADGVGSAFVINGTLAQQVGGRLIGDGSRPKPTYGGSYTLTSRFGGTATLQYRGADVVTNETFLMLIGPGSFLRDENGLDGMRNLAGNRGSLLIREGRNFTTTGNFDNNGRIGIRNRDLLSGDENLATPYQDTTFTVTGDLTNAGYEGEVPEFSQVDDRGFISVIADGDKLSRFVVRGTADNQGGIYVRANDSGTAEFVVEGSLANFNAATRTLSGGLFSVSPGVVNASARASIAFTGADIVTNEADIELTKLATPTRDATLFLVDLIGQSALRNFAFNGPAGRFYLQYTSFTTSGSLANVGIIELGNSATLTLPNGGTGPENTLTNSGRLRLNFESGINGDIPRLTTDVFQQTGGLANLNGRFAARDRFEFSGGEINLLPRGQLIAPEVRALGGFLRGSGNLTGNLFNDTVLAPSSLAASPSGGDVVSVTNTQGTLAVSGNLTLGANSLLEFTIGGPSNTDRVNATGAVVLGGNLRVTLTGSYVPAAGDTITVVTGGSPLTGAFANVPSGSRLATTDGRGDFVVTYAGRNSVTLGSFVPDPTFTPTPTPTPTPTSTPGPTPGPSPGGSPTPAPTPGPGVSPTPSASPSPDDPNSAVTISLRGKKKIKTFRVKGRVRGTAFSEVGIQRVVYRIGKAKRFRPARGTTTWKVKPRLKVGVNKILVFAQDASGTASPILRVRIRREERDSN